MTDETTTWFEEEWVEEDHLDEPLEPWFLENRWQPTGRQDLMPAEPETISEWMTSASLEDRVMYRSLGDNPPERPSWIPKSEQWAWLTVIEPDRGWDIALFWEAAQVVKILTQRADQRTVERWLDQQVDRELRSLLEEDFWQSREALKHIRDFAYARMCSPWAVLGVVIASVLHHIPPWVTLPPLIGDVGNFNVLIALVGASGTAKSAAYRAGKKAFDLHHEPINSVPLGSGEGIARQYKSKEDEANDHNAVLFYAAEIDGVAALANRNGSTLIAQLRAAFSGEDLGFAYRTDKLRLIVKENSYRFGLVAGIQPERARWLIDQSDGGTPQRFVWFPVADLGITADPPAEPDPLTIARVLSSWKPGPITLPDQVAREVREAHAARQRGDREALDGHVMYCRLKIAFALALLDERRAVSLEDWELAGQIMAKSDQVRTSVIGTIRRLDQAGETARALREGRRDAIKGEIARDDEFQRACQAIMRKLQRARGEWVRGKAARQAVAAGLRHHFDEAIDKLAETGQIEIEQVDHHGQSGIRLRLKGGTR